MECCSLKFSRISTDSLFSWFWFGTHLSVIFGVWLVRGSPPLLIVRIENLELVRRRWGSSSLGPLHLYYYLCTCFTSYFISEVVNYYETEACLVECIRRS